MIYKIEFKNHLKALNFFIVTSMFIILGFIIVGWDSEAVVFILLFYFLLSSPAFYLHIEYYLRNRGQKLMITDDEVVFYKNNVEIRRFAHNAIRKIILYRSASLDKGGIPISPLESYHYAEIISKNNEVLIITCLMSTDIKNALKNIRGVPMVKKRRLFASSKFSLPRLWDDNEYPL